ncbi:MAG: MBL fold metallo-hydrolase [Verrucomicrobia bacterium]|nr:MBL fold metallo-hydrolase [Verrucomicrobiota bacterium]MCG2681853.1 MBL fold metallo-hydrolase [Kiritimatiellia bacterium]MBU4247732.1 MBL fold metallo-hydrolase [Verrucomicrobiota bacterium]MBU4291616.1 MBL fold metallo-hydrolase [Verrucomicrobiota bacterium]MBU4429567.1 MBL fold metallo-hydrolase [Verrucomicrobiota bacterium]
MRAEITLVGNGGFRIAVDQIRIFIDAFYRPIPGVADAPSPSASIVTCADLILVTHAHGDHFNANAVAEVAGHTQAPVAGPKTVIAALRKIMPAERLVELEPEVSAENTLVAFIKHKFPSVTVTAFRTFHGREHNSYLVEAPGFRFFHDGDNENTRRLDGAVLGQLDALLIGPWQGSGWVKCIERLAPRRYFLMHLTDDELAQHAQNRFLPDICDHVPEGLVVLRPGESYIFG